jgi:hypothetical protein
MNGNTDPPLANTGRTVVGREVIDDSVLLADFERFLEIGEAMERGEPDPHAEDDLGVMWSLQASSIAMDDSSCGLRGREQRLRDGQHPLLNGNLCGSIMISLSVMPTIRRAQ